jgi:hypothetical protein
MGAAASGGTPFKRCTENRGRGEENGGGGGGRHCVPAGRGRRGSVLGRGAPGAADARAPTGSRRGREERSTGSAWASLEEKGLGRA